jgi:hypothetical protein
VAPVRVRIAQGAGKIVVSTAKIGFNIIASILSSKLQQWIEGKVTKPKIEGKLRKLEPTIVAKLNDQRGILAVLQLRNPGKTLYGNIQILTTIHRASGEDEEFIGLDVELVSVKVSTDKIDRSEQRRIWVGHYLTSRAPRNLIQTTYSVILEPLSKDELRAILVEMNAIAEFAMSHESSMALEAVVKLRDEMEVLLRRIDNTP